MKRRPSRSRRAKIIGIAGGSATGKSTIAGHLRRRGAGHIDADRIAHDILETDGSVRDSILKHFGEEVFTAGAVDRRKLGHKVFRDERSLKVLNSIIHPPIIQACVAALNSLDEAGHELIVIDAALLLEVPLPIQFDLTIALRCRRQEQEKRLRAKGGLSEEEVAARLDRQSDIEKSFYKADFILDTDGDEPKVLAEIDRLVDAWLGGEKA